MKKFKSRSVCTERDLRSGTGSIIVRGEIASRRSARLPTTAMSPTVRRGRENVNVNMQVGMGTEIRLGVFDSTEK